MSYYRASILSLGLLSLLLPFSVQAEDTTTTTVVEKRTIISPPPKGQCRTVAGHWQADNTWADTYTECNYSNRSEGITWVSEYWSCTVANADGTCTSWSLVPGHWVKTQ